MLFVNIWAPSICLEFNTFSDLQMDNLIADEDLEISGQQMVELRQNEDILPEIGQSRQRNSSADCCTVTNVLTKLMDNFIAKPIIKYRYIVLLIYIAITGLSLGAITHLKTASGRPELFPSNTNLQKLLNLQFNFSSSYIDCSSCSGSLLPVHRAARTRRYDGFRFPMRRSIDGLNDSESYRTTPGLKTNASTTASAMQARTGVNLTEASEYFVFSSGMEGNPVTTAPHNKMTTAITKTSTKIATTTATTANLHTAYPNQRTANVSDRFTYNSTRPVEKTLPVRKSAPSAVVPSKLPKAATTPVANFSIFYTKTSTAVSVEKRPTATDVGITEKHATQKDSTPIEQKRITSQITTSQKTFGPTTPPLCPKPCTPVKRPIVDKTAIVFLVFGVKGVKPSASKGKHFFDTNRVRLLFLSIGTPCIFLRCLNVVADSFIWNIVPYYVSHLFRLQL